MTVPRGDAPHAPSPGNPASPAGGSAPATPADRLLSASGLPASEARALLAGVLEMRREQLIAHPQTPVPAAAAEHFAALAARRRGGEPMAYLLGVQEFHGHRLRVTPDVLVPRPETELLVDTALELLAGRPGARVLDLGTGSGAIAIALALAQPQWTVLASDRSAAALRVAARNAAALGARVQLFAADWWQPVRGCFDLIVSNPPYVAAGDAHLHALVHEPRAALTEEADGLAALRAIIGGAVRQLAKGGWLLVEHGYDQGAAVRELMSQAGFEPRTLRDLAGLERACLGAPAAH